MREGISIFEENLILNTFQIKLKPPVVVSDLVRVSREGAPGDLTINWHPKKSVCHLNKHKAKKHPEFVTKKRVFQCNICHDTSSTDAKLKKHYSAVHNQILRDFLCAVCSKSYGDKRQLEVHNEVAHLKMKRFDCRVCGKKFGRRSSLRAHMTYLHSGGGSNFACDKCPIVYKSKRNLLNHVETVHAVWLKCEKNALS